MWDAFTLTIASVEEWRIGTGEAKGLWRWRTERRKLCVVTGSENQVFHPSTSVLPNRHLHGLAEIGWRETILGESLPPIFEIGVLKGPSVKTPFPP